MIFYQNPGDECQELAANELCVHLISYFHDSTHTFRRYQRDWRWHKKLQQWMMKAKEFGEPVISPSRQEERGLYYFWNASEWRRDRVSVFEVVAEIEVADTFEQREFILSYEHLHHVQPTTQNGQ